MYRDGWWESTELNLELEHLDSVCIVLSKSASVGLRLSILINENGTPIPKSQNYIKAQMIPQLYKYFVDKKVVNA